MKRFPCGYLRMRRVPLLLSSLVGLALAQGSCTSKSAYQECIEAAKTDLAVRACASLKEAPKHRPKTVPVSVLEQEPNVYKVIDTGVSRVDSKNIYLAWSRVTGRYVLVANDSSSLAQHATPGMVLKIESAQDTLNRFGLRWREARIGGDEGWWGWDSSQTLDKDIMFFEAREEALVIWNKTKKKTGGSFSP